MSIVMFTGRPGTGKTFTLVHKAIKALNKGEILYSNFKIEWEGFDESKVWYLKVLQSLGFYNCQIFPKSNLRSWTKLEDIIKIKDGIILMDEAHMYLNSRKWKELPFEFMRKLAQHRKDGIHIWGTVQNIRRLDVVMRELIDYWYDCTMTFVFVRSTEFDIDDDQKRRYPLRTQFIFFTKKRAQRYDTLEKVG